MLVRREAAARVELAARAQVPVPDQWRRARRGPAPDSSTVRWAVPVALALVTLVSLVLLVRAMLTDRDELLGEVTVVAPERTIWGLATAGCLAATLVFAGDAIAQRRRSALAARDHRAGVPVRYVVVDDDVALVLPKQDGIFGRFEVESGPPGPADEGDPSERLLPGILSGTFDPVAGAR